MRILGIVPARGGSKGIPGKNLVDLCGRPLVAWSIATGRALVDSGTITRCVVSTDDNTIAAVALDYGADVPFRRPADISTDTARAISYVIHALDTLEPQDGPYDAVMLLQPTNPYRNVATIIEAVARFEAGTSNSLISCYQEDYINDLVMYVDMGDGTLKPKHPDHNRGIRRQEHGAVMVRNGALYLTRVPYLRATGQVICDRPMLLRMRKIDSVDVNTPEDLEITRRLLCK